MNSYWRQYLGPKEMVRMVGEGIIVKLREREGKGVDPGRSLKGNL